MTDARERIWAWERLFASAERTWTFGTCPDGDGAWAGNEYRRTDAPTTLAEAMTVPEVRALVEASDRLKWQLAAFEGDLDDTDAAGMVRDYLGHVVPAARGLEAAIAKMKGPTP
jgi:hypothetical protein